jgi:hypothetical protein
MLETSTKHRPCDVYQTVGPHAIVHMPLGSVKVDCLRKLLAALEYIKGVLGLKAWPRHFDDFDVVSLLLTSPV